MTLSEVLRPHLQASRDIITEGFHDYDKHYSAEAKIAHTPSCRSHIRNCHMNARAAQYASANSGEMRMFDSKGLHGILIGQVVAIIFKKLDADLKSRNNITTQIADYRSQRDIPGIPAVYKLIAGYTEDEETGAFTGAYMTRPSGYANKWELPLSGDAVPPATTIPLFEEEEAEEADLFTRRQPGEVIEINREKKDGDG